MQTAAHNVGRMAVVLAKLVREPVLPEEGDRAAELLRIAGRQSHAAGPLSSPLS